MHHTIVISDIHLCQATAGDELWMRYRQQRFFPDQDFAALVDKACNEMQSGELECILNGDIFDFDAPPILHNKVQLEEHSWNESTAVKTVKAILEEHAVFITALAKLLVAGHTVVLISGNHDAQLAFLSVQESIEASILQAVHAQGVAEVDVRERLIFRKWFYTTRDAVHVEHGNEYDWYCSFRYPTEPFTVSGKEIQPTFGSLTSRHLVGKLGYFNPHVDSSFMLTFSQYFKHWINYYINSKRSLINVSVKGLYKIIKTELSAQSSPDAAHNVRLYSETVRETDADPEKIRAHVALFAKPSEEHLFSMIRELWIDRFAFFLVSLIVLGCSLIWWEPHVWEVALAMAILFAIYEYVVPKPPLESIYKHLDVCARSIAKIYQARGVVFGHTHIPLEAWEHKIFFGNSGTWAPAFHDVECKRPALDGKPVIWLKRDEIQNGDLQGGLFLWRDKQLLPWSDKFRTIEL